MTQAFFAIPGDKNQRTGGYIYDATVLDLLNEMGCPTAHLELPASFPTPTAEDMTASFDALRSVPKECPVIIDGLALGALDPDPLADINAPIIAMVHHPLGLETGLSPERAAALMRNEAATLRHAAHVIVPSPYIAETLTSQFDVPRDQITVASPGFAKVQAVRTPVDPPLILSVGILAQRKGHDVLIDALAQIRDLTWNCQIVGKALDGAVARALKDQTQTNGLSDRVQFRGEVDANDLQELYSEASLFALATRYEGYGMVLSEAMAHALPVVSCAVGAVPGTVGQAGLLVPPDDAGAFAAALRELLSTSKTYDHYANAARQAADTLPTWRDTTQHFINVIKAVTS